MGIEEQNTLASRSEDSVSPAFELKGRRATLTVIRILDSDARAFGVQLAEKVATAPALLRGGPVVLDVTVMDPGLELRDWVDAVRAEGLVPIGVSGASEARAARAVELGLALFPRLLAPREPSADALEPPELTEATPAPVPPGPAGGEPAPEPASAPGGAPSAGLPGKVVRQPVRSGQQIYARGGDLVVLASVSPGAEVMADGNIHIYGTLHGRALAGVTGYRDARIFCTQLQAQLVSVSGWYKTSEELEPSKGPVQVYLRGEQVMVKPL